MNDTLGRPLRNLRLSVTDRCNLRCEYCMPEDDYVWLPREDVLHFEETSALVDVFLALGVDYHFPGLHLTPGLIFGLQQPATFQLQCALFDRAGQNNFEFIIIDREMKKLIRTRLAGFQRNCALIAAGESGKNDVISDFADFLENVKAIAWSVANRI